MRRRSVLVWLMAVAVLATGCAARAPSWVQASSARYTKQITLPAPLTDGAVSLERALGQRRSVRSFRPDPLSLTIIGQLLWAGQGITSPDGKRTAPSAGALYPLELYVVTPTELMHYRPQRHQVDVRAVPDLRPALESASFRQESVGTAPDVVVVAAVPGRTTREYGARGEAYVEREAGHAAQNILLQATACGIGAVPVGGLEPQRAATALALPAGETVLYLIPVGKAK